VYSLPEVKVGYFIPIITLLHGIERTRVQLSCRVTKCNADIMQVQA